MRSVRPPRFSQILSIAGAFLLLGWAVFLIWGVRFSDAQWARILPGFQDAEGAFGATPPGHIRVIVGLTLLLLSVLLGLAALAAHYKEKLLAPEVRARLVAAAVALAAIGVLFDNVVERGWEAPWYHIADMMTHPQTVPVFGQRLLMIWPAMLIKHLVPRLSYIQSFIIAQGLGIVLAVYVIGEWSALFVGRELKFLGQILLTVFLLPTAVFYAGHDIGVVFSYCFCFLFLYKRQYPLFLLAFCIGILNHQNILLLIPTAIVVMWRVEDTKTIAWVGAVATIAYFSIQYLLNRMVPVPITHEIKVWWNMRQIVQLYRMMIFGAMLTIPWYVGAALAFKSADPFLKRASVLLPMQLGIYSIYGQLNEARLFNGFLPILIGIYLCYVRERFLAKSAARSLSEVQGAVNVAVG
jgi:hypothetical protein